ncbi:Ger(x)C family spore germination protein [Paenibacillus sepulcri]|uniref:Ger(X)C family spore germination protein n=1 Tax=Paenibacillus sepulcri TaxID=359917 RepID=A0ABS7BZG7_9BACL|nr:Ger(x)C family spore germination protein [Paenibacillus sepulcri]
MNTRLLCMLLSAAIVGFTASGCSDQLDLENASIPLAIGMDLDNEDKFHFYSTAPVFSKNIKKKSQEISGTAPSLRQSRAKQDAHTVGVAQGRNFQVILVGKRMLKHEGWVRMLDVIYRDPRNTQTDRVIAVDGSVSEIIHLNPPDQPLLPVLLRGMIDTKSARSETVKTTALELHRQIYEKGITPYISEVKISNKNVFLSGTALLHNNGRYAASLGAQETILLSILQKNAKPGVSLSFHIPGEPKTGPFDTDMLNFSTRRTSTKIKTSCHHSKFQFDIKIKMVVSLSEHLFPYDIAKHGEALEHKVSKLAQAQFESLIQTIQKHRIDPIGLGLYARAHEFREYKKVEEHWGDALANADMKISVAITFGAMGPVK